MADTRNAEVGMKVLQPQNLISGYLLDPLPFSSSNCANSSPTSILYEIKLYHIFDYSVLVLPGSLRQAIAPLTSFSSIVSEVTVKTLDTIVSPLLVCRYIESVTNLMTMVSFTG
jgi:hypothetical protein